MQSLLSQTVRTKIVMSASEPEASVISLAEKYQIPLFVNKGEKGIARVEFCAFLRRDASCDAGTSGRPIL